MPTRKAIPTRKAPRSQEAFLVAENVYRDAMNLYIQKRDWSKAKDAFRAYIDSYKDERDVAEMVDRARVHMAACEDKLAPAAVEPKNADEWMLQGVAASNLGQTDEALAAYSKAGAMGAPKDKVEYARAAVLSMAERHEEALEALKQAIELNRDNRVFSLSDPDFERLRETAGYVALVDPPTEIGSRMGGLMVDGSSSLDDYDDEELNDDDDDAAKKDDEPEEFGSEDEIV